MTADWGTLQRGIGGDVVLPASADYESVRQPVGELYDTLASHGLTIPAGCGPSVGIAGLTLGGGLGILGRKHGLTCDHLLGAQIVLADGRIVDCDEHRDGELFWALCGAGGGHFGVVTSLVFRTLPAPATTVCTWLATGGERAPGVEVVAACSTARPTPPSSSASWSTGWEPTRWRHQASTCLTGRPSGTLRGWDRSRTGPRIRVRSGHRGRATSPPSRSSSAGPSRARRSRRWSSTSPRGWPSASRGRWTSCPGAAPTTAYPPTPPPSPTATSASWSSIWSRSAPTPPRSSAAPPPTGWRAPGRWCIHGDPRACTRTSPTRPAGLGPRLPRDELRPPATRQGGVRPGRLLPLPPVACVAARLPACSQRRRLSSHREALDEL